MKVSTIAWLAAVMIAVTTALPSAAAAQMFNQPFSFKYRGGAGENVGMSTAHRQLILERELAGRSADNPLVRDPTGALLEVERANGGQAFLRTPASPFLAESAGERMGFGLSSGSGGNGGGVLLGAGTNRVMASWILSLTGGDGYRGVYPRVIPASAASIDVWIDQLSVL